MNPSFSFERMRSPSSMNFWFRTGEAILHSPNVSTRQEYFSGFAAILSNVVAKDISPPTNFQLTAAN